MSDKAGPSAGDARALMEKLAPIQAKKGYFFNPEGDIALDLLHQLLVTKARYGYMTCPCRLAAAEREKDQDIICPCTYREPDVVEYGACYCGLYVSKAFLESGEETPEVPERRPPGNIVILG